MVDHRRIAATAARKYRHLPSPILLFLHSVNLFSPPFCNPVLLSPLSPRPPLQSLLFGPFASLLSLPFRSAPLPYPILPYAHSLLLSLLTPFTAPSLPCSPLLALSAPALHNPLSGCRLNSHRLSSPPSTTTLPSLPHPFTRLISRRPPPHVVHPLLSLHIAIDVKSLMRMYSVASPGQPDQVFKYTSSC